MDDSLVETVPTRVAFLFPSLDLANYWHPIFQRFTQLCPATMVYTSHWQGYAPGLEETFKLKQLGKYKSIRTDARSAVYQKHVAIVPVNVIQDLIRDRTQVVFTSAYSMWTLLVVALKPIFGWKVVILYEGWSPSYDYSDSKLRLWSRRWMTQTADACVTNSPAGERYLIQTLKANPRRVWRQPYQVPDLKVLLGKAAPQSETTEAIGDRRRQSLPIRFLFVGRVISRKGIKPLIQACEQLQANGVENFQLTIIGDGSERVELETRTRTGSLGDRVEWVGKIPYDQLRDYFQMSDVFVFPTLEDTWGMALLEAMAFGKPVICSKFAGAAECMVMDDHNGFTIDPQDINDLVDKLRRFIEQPDRIAGMGKAAAETIAQYTPDTATQFLLKASERVMKQSWD